MEQRLSFITLGVHDFDAMKHWYIHTFGWQPVKDDQGICFFKLNGIILALYPADELAADIGIPQDGSGFRRFSLSMNFHSEDAVREAMQTLQSRGARIILNAEPVFWGGFRGYIADPEDNYWELAYNPFMPLDEKGNIA